MGEWSNWVIDASMGGEPLCLCPVEGDLDGDFTIVTGVNFLGAPPAGGRVVAVVHPDGQEAVEAFCAHYADAIAALMRATEDLSTLPDPGEAPGA